MIQQALQKLQAEIHAGEAAGNDDIKFLGDHMMKHLQSNQDQSHFVLADGKTLAGAIAALQAEARQKRKRMLNADIVFGVVMRYYGIQHPEAAATPTANTGLSLNIDDLL